VTRCIIAALREGAAPKRTCVVHARGKVGDGADYLRQCTAAYSHAPAMSSVSRVFGLQSKNSSTDLRTEQVRPFRGW